MTLQQTTESSSQIYDNNGQYTRKGILRYERIFGEGYISTGGHETTLYLCSKLEGRLLPGRGCSTSAAASVAPCFTWPRITARRSRALTSLP